MKTIYFPVRFDRDTLSDFFEELDNNLDTAEVCLDCSTLRYSFPTAMLVAGSKIRTWVKTRHKNKLKTKNQVFIAPTLCILIYLIWDFLIIY